MLRTTLFQKTICSLLCAVALMGGAVSATEYTTPVPSVPTETVSPTPTMAPPTGSEPTETAVPTETEEPTGAADGFTVPGATGKPSRTESPTETSMPSAPPSPTETAAGVPSALDNQAYMDAITMAFMDGVKVVTPDQPRVTLRAILLHVPEDRMGSAQWLIDGVPQGEYYSSEFPIYNGRISEMELEIPFTRESDSYDTIIALEVHLNGVVRRIEKVVAIRNYQESWYDEQEQDDILTRVRPVEIEATVRYWTHTYTSKYLSQSNGGLDAGQTVIYTDHYGTSAASIWIPEEGRACWVPYDAVRISTKNYTVEGDFTNEEKERFVNAMGYESTTDYLVWVNLERQRVNVFEGSAGNWRFLRTSTCSTGANTTPTPAGVMTYCAYGDGWYHDTYYVRPVMYLDLSRGIALHSILFNPNGSVQDGTQGRPVSHGCVRMPAYEINWLASYVPVGSTVVVY